MIAQNTQQNHEVIETRQEAMINKRPRQAAKKPRTDEDWRGRGGHSKSGCKR